MAKARKKKRQPSHSTLLSRAVKKAINKYFKLFRLPDWPIYFKEADKITDADGDACVAGITIDDDNNEVRISYLATMRLEAVDQVMCHEFVHWVLQPLSRYLDHTLPPKSFRHAKALLESATEAVSLAIVQPNRRQPTSVIEEEPCDKK